jgi:hypothetical protein
MKNLLGDFKVKLGRENIVKPTTGNKSLHQDSNDNGRIYNTDTSKNRCSHTTLINTPGPLLMGRLTTKLITC